MYLVLRALILLILVIIAIEDIRTKTVSSIFLYAVNILQIISASMLIQTPYFKVKIIISLIVFVLYFSIKFFKKFVGESDIIFLCFQFISLDTKSFIIFWWSYLIFSLIYGIIIYIHKNDSYIPMFPAFAFGELCIIIYLGGIL